MVHTTYFRWFGGWFSIVLPTLIWKCMHKCRVGILVVLLNESPNCEKQIITCWESVCSLVLPNKLPNWKRTCSESFCILALPTKLPNSESFCALVLPNKLPHWKQKTYWESLCALSLPNKLPNWKLIHIESASAWNWHGI